MGARGPQPKAIGRQRRNRAVELVVSSRLDPPAVPRGLLKVTRERWERYWESDIAKVAQQADFPAIERLFQLYDERDRAYRQVRRDGRVSKGSTGQPVEHPLLKYMDTCHKEIRALEDRLGIMARGRLQLGASFMDAMRSLDDLNRSLEADDDKDPRLS